MSATYTDKQIQDIQRIRRRWARASDIQLEDDRCPACKRRGRFYSLQLPEDIENVKQLADGTWEESCGYYCCSCNWGNAGSRTMKL